ncbi:ribonuclease H-like domain-containing protein [Tanacetum coccineum]
MAGEDEFHDDNPPLPPPVTPTQQAPHTLSTIKLPILKKGEYDIWAMKMELYLGHTDYPICEVIQKVNGPVQVSTDTNGQIRVLPPKTAEEILARERERKARTTLLMSLLEDHLVKFYKMTNAKEMWEASIQIWSVPRIVDIEGLSLGVDTLSFDDIYNNLRVFESDVKGSTASSSSTQNVAFVSSESTSSTNEVSTAYGVSTSSGHNSQKEGSSSQIDELKYSFFANQSSGPQLDHKDLEQAGKEEPKALVTLDGDGVDWTGHAEDEQENFALMAYSNSGSDTEVTSCSKECEESYAKLKKLYDEQREQLGDASIEIQAYTQALKKVEAQLVCHQKNQLVYEEKIRFMKIDLDDKTNVLIYHKKLLAEAVKEKEELKTKLENFQSSSKGLSKLLNSQMSAKDKSGLGYGDQIHEGVLSYENEVLESVFDSRSSDVEDSPVYDRFAKVEGMHAVPPPMTGIYMPPKSDFGIDDVETLESVPKPAVNEPKAVSKPKVWSDAPIIEEYESDSDDEYVIEPLKEQEKPSFAFVNTVKIFSHLIRDCDFHEKRMAKQVELNKQKGKGTGQGANRPVWNNVQRLNHQNKFVPKAVLTKTGIFLVNTARQNLSSQAAATSTARKVNTARPIVNKIRPRNNFYKSHSPIRKPSNRTTTPKANFANHKVNTAGDKTVSAVGGNRETAVKASAGCNWRSKRHYWNKVSKYNSGSNSSKNDDPQKALKNKGIVDSGCSRHMTGNKAYLVEYQDYNGGPVAFGGSKGQITGKGKIITGKLDFEDVYFVKELKQFNLFSVSQMCDKKNKVLFTDSECLVLSPDFKLPDENQVLLRVPRQNNMYSFNLENIVPTGGLACLIAKATVDESNKWHRRLVAERKNRTLIEAARTMLADSFLPNTFWAEAVSTACYVLNRVLVTKPQNKTPYELITGKIPIISYIKPFGCHVTILNTIDYLGKFKEKSDEGFLVGYYLNSKAFRVYNLETKRVKENLHINFLENKPNVAGKGPNWLFDLDYLTDSMNYQPVTAENKANKTAGPKEANHSTGTQDNIDAGNSKMEAEPAQEYFVLPLWSSYTSTVKSSEAKNGDEKPNGDTSNFGFQYLILF